MQQMAFIGAAQLVVGGQSYRTSLGVQFRGHQRHAGQEKKEKKNGLSRRANHVIMILNSGGAFNSDCTTMIFENLVRAAHCRTDQVIQQVAMAPAAVLYFAPVSIPVISVLTTLRQLPNRLQDLLVRVLASTLCLDILKVSILNSEHERAPCT